MQKLIALLVVALSSVTLHAQVVWIEENVDFFSGVRTGVIEVNGDTYTIGPDGPDAPPQFCQSQRGQPPRGKPRGCNPGGPGS